MESGKGMAAPARQRASSGARWEPIHGYSRAIRAGDAVYVSGTVGIWPDETVAPGAYDQTARALDIIRIALEELGSGLQDVVRTRVFVTDISHFEEVARAHREAFADIRPASTTVEVSKLLRDDFLVEIEADAVLPSSS